MDQRLTLATACLLVIAIAPTAAQRGEGGRAEPASPPTPRFADGLVDFGGDGIWMQPWITDFGAQLVDRKEIPFLPWTKAMYDYNKSNAVAYDPQGFCLPPGGPRSMGTPYPSVIAAASSSSSRAARTSGARFTWMAGRCPTAQI